MAKMYHVIAEKTIVFQNYLNLSNPQVSVKKYLKTIVKVKSVLMRNNFVFADIKIMIMNSKAVETGERW